MKEDAIQYVMCNSHHYSYHLRPPALTD